MSNRYVVALILLTSCASYRQSIMFKPTEFVKPDQVKKEVLSVEKNYVIQKNDLLTLELYSNQGERLIDPNPELSGEIATVSQTGQAQTTYLVDLKGIVRFPLVGEINLQNFTLRQAEEILQKEYAKFFKEPFVLLTFVNKRIILLGAVGGQVIPLTNENMSVLEVLALAKGLPPDSKAQSIKLIRGEQVIEIDLSTIQGFRDGNLIVESGDVIYVDPVIRPFSVALRDYAGAISLLVSVVTLLVVVRTF